MKYLLIIITLLISITSRTIAADSTSDWLENMKSVHSKFTGSSGTFAHFGDSITVTLAYWTPMLYERKNASPEMEAAYSLTSKYMQKQCWREWKGSRYGNQSSMTIRWADKNIASWLKELNPETALIMFGTNDLHSVPLEEYNTKLRHVVKQCLDNGTVVILSTIPPRHKMADKAAVYSETIRKTAKDLKVPLIDFHREVLQRRPTDWDGASEKFAKYKGYDVPTLLARDGVHPSHPKKFSNDYSEDALKTCGFSLRNYLALMQYAEMIKELYQTVPSRRPVPRKL